MNTFGNRLKLTTFGESHGPAIGGILDGCPAGILLDLDAIQMELNRRKPGQSKLVTQRKEADEVKFLSGIFEGKTTGTSIGFIIENTPKDPMTTNTSRMFFDHHMPIIRINKNTDIAITEVEAEVRRVKQPIG